MSDNCILQKKTDIGLIREKNEDACCALSHPNDKNIKFGYDNSNTYQNSHEEIEDELEL